MDFQPILVIEKVAMLFFVLLCGFYAAKRGFLSESTPRSLSLFLVNVTQPALIVSSFNMEYSEEKIETGFLILAFSILIHLVLCLVARVSFLRVKDPDQNRVYQCCLIFCNCSFLGFPVLNAIFGEGVGVFYGTFYCIMFNLLNFTYGIHLLRRGRGEKPRWYKAILNPGVLSTLIGLALFLLRIDLPNVADISLKTVGDMTFPVSMVIVGALLAKLPLSEIFTNAKYYFFIFAKSILWPALLIGVFYLVGLRGEIAVLLVTMGAVPSAASNTIFAETYESDSALAARLVGMTTLFSVITLPAMVILANFVLG